MKKAIKISAIILLIIITPIVLMYLLMFLVGFFLFQAKEYNIKTEYGDSFVIYGGGFIGEYHISEENNKSIILATAEMYYKKSDLQPICDTDSFRAYSFINKHDEIYIMKIKKYDKFFVIYKDEEKYNKHIFESIIKTELLSDIELMKVVLPYFNQYYHNELLDIAQTLNSDNIQSLNQYGLTQEMIDDEETLNQKKQLINSILDKK